MPKQAPAHTLPMGHTRMINASEGLRLEVTRGCLWLTRPGDPVDRFLIAGSSMALHDKQVVIQSDRVPATPLAVASEYRLTPLGEAQPQNTGAVVKDRRLWRLRPSCA